MKLVFSLAISCLVVLGLFGCSIDAGQIATPTAGIAPNNSTPSASTTKIPLTWAGLNLTGRLVYITVSLETGFALRIQALDLATGEIKMVFATSGDDWIFYVTLSPDSKQLVMSYIPPSQSGSLSSRALYIMPLDATALPQPLFPPPTIDDHYVQAEWSPDGQYIYYVHYNNKDQPIDQPFPAYDILRMRYPNGQPEKIADHAFWPRVSSDSTKLVYVSIDPDSGKNELYVANADGSNPQRIAFSGPWIPEVIDAPIFSPDGQSILFSAPPPLQVYQPNWLETLMGIQIAKAHSVPSDWWSVPVIGGVPARLTQIQTINLFASLSPDARHLASVSGERSFVRDTDGSNLTQALSERGVSGTVSWIP